MAGARIAWTALSLLLASTANARDIPTDDKAIISAVWENDIFGGTDQNYTNGLRLSWLSSEREVPELAKQAAKYLPLADEGKKRIGFALGQNMYTPVDLTRRDPILDDRPYAGWLYGSFGIVSDTGDQLDNVMLSLGMVGPASLAHPTQDFVHDLIGSQKGQGWHNQLDNEPGVVLTAERKWRAIAEYSPFGTGVDFTPHVGVNLGNVNTDASLGFTVRLGYDLPADYGAPRIRPSLPGSDFFIPTQELGGYLFAGFDGRAVARNIFLDGNTFKDSLDVNKKPLIGSIQTGAALTWGNVRLSYTHVFMTKEFDEQLKAPDFGAVTVSYRF
jgi:hypothetical protein